MSSPLASNFILGVIVFAAIYLALNITGTVLYSMTAGSTYDNPGKTVSLASVVLGWSGLPILQTVPIMVWLDSPLTTPTA